MSIFMFIIPILIFILLFLFERRTIWIGFLFILLAGYLSVFSVIYLESTERSVAFGLIFILAIVFVLFPLYIVSFIIALITSGIRLIKREGRKLHNFLSLTLGIFIIVWSIAIGFIDVPPNKPFWMSVVFFLTYAVGYFFFIMICFAIAALFNCFRLPWKNYHYIIVLGSGLIGSKVPPLLASRIDKGINLLHKAQEKGIKAKIIFTGGQGSDEAIAEGVAMAAYAKHKGVNDSDIIIEDKAVSTFENLLFSRRLIEADWATYGIKKHPNIITVTNNFHVFRALLWAKKVGFKSDGAGAQTKFYFWLNALIREFVAVLSMQRAAHIFILCLGLAIAVGMFVINHYFVIPYEIGA